VKRVAGVWAEGEPLVDDEEVTEMDTGAPKPTPAPRALDGEDSVTGEDEAP
jgi:hypothetical protein